MVRKKQMNVLQRSAQATLEFVFAFIVLALIFYGCVRGLQWLGVVLLSPSNRHYQGLYTWSGANNAGTASYVYSDQLLHVDATLPRLKIVYPGQLVNP